MARLNVLLLSTLVLVLLGFPNQSESCSMSKLANCVSRHIGQGCVYHTKISNCISKLIKDCTGVEKAVATSQLKYHQRVQGNECQASNMTTPANA